MVGPDLQSYVITFTTNGERMRITAHGAKSALQHAMRLAEEHGIAKRGRYLGDIDVILASHYSPNELRGMRYIARFPEEPLKG